MIDTLLALDEKYFLLINQSGLDFLDPIMLFITYKFSWIPFYGFLIYLIFKQKGKEGFWILLSIALLITMADQGSVQFFKNVFERSRPCHVLEQVRLVTERCGGQFGFVSSHASNAFALAIFLGKVLENKKWFVGLFIWAALVAYSRVYVGVHYPLDIIGGMLWGTFVALVMFKMYQLKNLFDKNWFLWLALVCVWNFGWPSASPIVDVLVAAMLSVVVHLFKNRK